MKPDQALGQRKIKDFLKRTTFSLKMMGTLSFIVIWVVLFYALVPEQANWEVGTVANVNLQADRSITYEDKSASNKKREEALRGVEDVYQLNLDRFNQLTMVAIDRSFGDLEKIVRHTDDGGVSLSNDEKIKQIQAQLSLELSDNEWKQLLDYNDKHFELLHKQTVALVSNVMGAGIRDDDLAKAKEDILHDVSKTKALSSLDKEIVWQLLDKITFYATSIYDQAATKAKKDEILRQVEPVWQSLQKGQMIVNKGDVITPAQYDAMEALGLTTDRSVLFIGLGVLALDLMFFLLIHLFLRRYAKPEDFERNFKLMLCVLLLNVVLAAAVFSIHIGETTVVMDQIGYLMPIAAGGMLVAVLVGSRPAVFMLMLMTMVVGLYAQNASIVVANMVGGIAGVFQTRRLNRRLDLGWAAVYISAIMSLAIIGFGLAYGFAPKVILLGVCYAIANGFLSVVLTIGLLPYFEVAFDLTTSMSLLELSYPSNKLLKRLMNEAPGTYHHSIMGANLAEAAAEAIGADPLLVRTGAYYHDIGKIRRPLFFAENQFGNEDPYANVTPMLATLIITSHVKDGVAMAHQARLPESVIDLIAQHHGNTAVQYFYMKALETDKNVEKDLFRYHQKKP